MFLGGLFLLFSIFAVYTGITSGHGLEAGQEDYGHPRAFSYLAFWCVAIWYALTEGTHDAKKIIAHKPINHASSAVGRLTGLALWTYVSGMCLLFPITGTLLNFLLGLGAFSFIFNWEINIRRGLQLTYIPKKPGLYDGIFNGSGELKFTIEATLFVGSILRTVQLFVL